MHIRLQRLLHTNIMCHQGSLEHSNWEETTFWGQSCACVCLQLLKACFTSPAQQSLIIRRHHRRGYIAATAAVAVATAILLMKYLSNVGLWAADNMLKSLKLWVKLGAVSLLLLACHSIQH